MHTVVHMLTNKNRVFPRCVIRRWRCRALPAHIVFGTAALLNLTVLAQAARDLKARPAWDYADAPSRLMVERGEDDFFLVRIQAKHGGKPVAAIKAFLTKSECAAAVVWRDDNELTVLVNASEAKRKQIIRIYPVLGDAAIMAGTSAVTDPTPLRGTARRTAGMDLPSSLADVKTLKTRCDGKERRFAVKDFSQLGDTFEDWFRGDWTRKNHLVNLQTWLLVPSDGKYMFGLAGVAPAWLLVDGRETLAHPDGMPHDQWTSGDEVPLKAGLRHVSIMTVCRQKIDTGLAWKRVGEPGTATNVTMVTGGDLRVGRWERRDRTLHPFATVESGAAYRFAGMEDMFVPFTLKDGSACWGTNHTARWEVVSRGQGSGSRGQGAGVRKLGEGETVTAVILASQLPASAKLTAAASSGETEVYGVDIEYDGPVWNVWDVTTRMAGVPAVCYEDDRVNPIIRMRTSANDGMPYELCSEFQWRSKPVEKRSQKLMTNNGWASVYTGEVEAGEIECISWSLRHHGVEISNGATRFVREPYDFLPDMISGESLKYDGKFVVLLASKVSRGDIAPASAPQSDGGTVVLDGFMYGGMGHGMGGNSASNAWQILDLREAEQERAATGSALLMPFAALKRVLPASLVVYAPSLTGVSREDGTGAFERRLSGMTGLVAGPAGGSPRVLLVVPPQFDVLPDCGCSPGEGPCEHAAKARDYAETVIRVADAHGIETVDLFTAFQTASPQMPLIRNGMFTEAGTALAETLIRKKILAR
jgi:hypothetical protein